MRTTMRLLPAVLLCLASAAAYAVAVPLPTKEFTLNLTTTVQTQALIQENGAPSGSDPSYDIFARRTRVQANGEIGKNWAYYFQVDNANFGKFGNFTGRMIVQDAFASFAPLGQTGGTVIFIDGGLMFYPASRFIITPISNQLTVEGHPDMLRGFTAANFPANRSTGLQARGWLLEKKVGFRGGIFEGQQPTSAATGPNPQHYPAFALLTNFDIIGSEEGGYLYPAVKWGKDPILSVGVAGTYQSKALRTNKGLANQRSLTGTVYFNYPLSEQQEFIALIGGYLFGNGVSSKDTGKGGSVDVSFRYDFVRPYVAYEAFDSDDCPTDGSATPGQCAGANGVHAADSRNFRAGLDFYINKSQNHVQLEFSLNRGQSAWGPQSITAANAGYVPFIPAGQPGLLSLQRTAQKSLLLHWSVYF
jgi:hypothetical protein